MASKYIKIKGAKEHNLKKINVNIPRDKFTVVTGLSGSGKSSLAFDTVYAEGQRRYMESLSSYARQFLGQMEKPSVESIEGLPPAISIDQKSTNKNPRSTVGTVTEIYDYLRLLYARIGIPHCPNCGKEIKKQTIDEIIDQILKMEEGTKFMVLAPVVRGKKGRHEKVLDSAKKAGYVRAVVNGEVLMLEDDITLDKNIKNNIDIVIDRLSIRDGIKQRLTDSVETALKLAKGLVVIEKITKTKKTEDKKKALTNTNDNENRTMYSQNFACMDCGISIDEIQPRSFSFNNPFGACPECSGLGFKQEFDLDLMIPDRSLSINEGALQVMGWQNAKNKGSYNHQVLVGLAEKYGFDLDTPFEEYPKKIQDIIIYGTKGEEFDVEYTSRRGSGMYRFAFEGLIETTKRRYREAWNTRMKLAYEEYMSVTPCPVCQGQRLKKESLAVTVGDKNIFEFTELPVRDGIDYIDRTKLNSTQKKIGAEIIKEVKGRLQFLQDVGLEYLTLSRATGTLSGGEAQRIRLATQIGSGLVGVAYIMDEPSIGLHQNDNAKLLKTLKKLKDIGNTLIVVEHDEETMRAADHIIDIGPRAGLHGGKVVAEGKVEDIIANPKSLTGQYLSGEKKIKIPKSRRKPTGFVTVKGAQENNLKEIDVDIPLGVFTCVTGVSGSGKSSLVNEILYKRLARDLNRAQTRPGKHKGIEGEEALDKIINIDQSPIGRTPRSNPATYTGMFDQIRDLFAATKDAKERGYKKGRFSFNVKGGRCEACSGDGILKVEMHFLPDVYVPCEVCGGKRYNRETLEVKYKGKNIYEVLEMTVEEAMKFFQNVPKIYSKVKTLYDVGLGYIKLGQPSTTLSGGEAQRIKLATELSKRSTGRTIYILDEPTTGLHFSDVHKLVKILHKLVEGGNTVVVIEHNLDVIKVADYIIDMGPDGGDRGGTVVVSGTPEEVAKHKTSYTAKYIRKELKK
ncbi:MAG: excinuclease ABC subunit UvrA [Eubacterium sp.]|nr:excinuclease ABC subunit UvrA [Eubacterium sp.]